MKKDSLINFCHKTIKFVALVYIIYYIACSLFSILGLLTNGISSVEGAVLLCAYLITIGFGIFVGQFKFKYELVFVFALLVQVLY